MIALLPILLAPACDWFIEEATTDPPRDCSVIEPEIDAELEDIRSCTWSSECGQVLVGTSCGCSEDLVARRDADVARFWELAEEGIDGECEVPYQDSCDCHEAYGFECREGTCRWDYAEGEYLPDCQAIRGDPYDIAGASIAGDTLTVEVAYTGGCDWHEFTLCWPSQTFAESNPVQAKIEPIHDANGDACDLYVVEDQTFDLSPLKQAWIDAYGATSGTIQVRVGDERLEYAF